MATQAALNVNPQGSSQIAFFSQAWGALGTVYVQASALVDATSGTSAAIDANGLHVVPSLGTPKRGLASSSALANGSTVTLTSSNPVTNGKTGTLQHAIFSGTAPISWQLQTVDNAGSVSNVGAPIITDAYRTFDFRAVMNNQIATVLATTTNVVFQVAATSLSQNASIIATANASFFWAEN